MPMTDEEVLATIIRFQIYRNWLESAAKAVNPFCPQCGFEFNNKILFSGASCPRCHQWCEVAAVLRPVVELTR